MSTLPGRNDPCYCGSGKKYKKCHMPEDKQKERSRVSYAMATSYVRRELIKFARDSRFSEAFAAALTFYWNGLYDIENADDMSETEALRFMDWFVYDYHPEDGPRLADVFAEERRAELSEAQQEVLDAWMSAGPASGYELIGYEDQMLSLRDFFTGESFEVFATNGRGNVDVGEVILARIVPMRDRLQFSTTAAYLPADEITDVREKIAAAKETFLAENPDADHATFMRRHNHLLVHHALVEAERVGRPPVARLDTEREESQARALARMLSMKQGRRRRQG